jgi:catechol 2,3-dioxygenase-like lactoylglutathione lyase family enzyme
MAIQVHDLCALLSVYDMPEAVRFYSELLGFELVSRAPTYETIGGVEHFHWCMLRNGSSYLMLNTEYDTGERLPCGRGLKSSVFGRRSPSAARILRRRGASWRPQVWRAMGRSLQAMAFSR